MLNKRKALIGYTTYVVGTALVKMKLRKEPRKKAKKILVGGTAAAAGATGVFFWRKRNKGEELPSEPPPES